MENDVFLTFTENNIRTIIQEAAKENEDLTALETTEKGSLTDAVNEIYDTLQEQGVIGA